MRTDDHHTQDPHRRPRDEIRRGYVSVLNELGIGRETIEPMPEKPLLPDELQPVWAELLAVTEQRRKAQDELDKASARARELVVQLLRERVDRKYLVGRPFSSAGLSIIQKQEGLVKSRKRPPA